MKNIGIIGCGWVTEFVHLPSMQGRRDGKIVALADVDTARARKMATRFGVPNVYSDADALFAQKDIDIVAVNLPNHLHAPMAIKAARAKKHILVEKPITADLKEADAMIREAKKNRVKIMVSQTLRFEPVHEVARDVIEKGTIGKIVSLRCRIGHEGPEFDHKKAQWFFSKKQGGGGCMMDVGVHAADLIRFLTGSEVKSVKASVKTLVKKIPVEDNALAILEMKSGIPAIIEASWSQNPGSVKTTVYGEKGTLEMAGWDKGTLELLPPFPKKPKSYKIPKKSKHGGVLPSFIKSLKNKKKPLVTGEDGRENLRIVFKCYEASKKGKTIKL